MSSAFINSLGSSFGSLTTTQTKSQSRTKKKTTQSGKIVVKKNMTAQGYLIRMANAKSPAQVAGIIRAARADANAMKNSDAGKTAIAEAQKIADAIENKGTLKISRLKKEQQLRQKKQIEESCGAKKKAALTSKQLKKKKRARKAEERADAANAITPYKNKQRRITNLIPHSPLIRPRPESSLMLRLRLIPATYPLTPQALMSVYKIFLSLYFVSAFRKCKLADFICRNKVKITTYGML